MSCSSGSSRETSPLSLKYLGVQAIVAKMFARIFYRNAINLGIALLECPETDAIRDGDKLSIDLEAGLITNQTTGDTYACSKTPAHIMQLIDDGGLVAHLKKTLR